MQIKLGIAPINWSNDDDPSLGKDMSFEQCIEEMAKAQYVGTELGNKFPKDPTLLKTSLEKQGLQLASSWFSTYFTVPGEYQNTLSRFLDHLSFMKAMGSSFINLCECGHAIQGTDMPVIGSYKPVFTEEQWQQLIQGLHALGRMANEFNLKVSYHYHAGTGVFTEEEIDYLMAHTSPQLLSLLLDTGHGAFAKIDSLDLIKKHGHRIQYVHLKDIRAQLLSKVYEEDLCFMDGVRQGVFTVPGDGCIDFPKIIKALRALNYQGWMIVEAEQDPAKAPALEYALKAYDYLAPLIS